MSKEIVIKKHTISSNKTTICVPIVAKTYNEILSDIRECVSNNVELIEIRADFFDKLMDKDELVQLLEDIKTVTENVITLFTIRTRLEGGEIEISNDEFEDIVLTVAKSKTVDMIDVELLHFENGNEIVKKIQDEGVKVVASHHNFEFTYDDEKIVSVYEKMINANADICKIAMMPKTKDDTLRQLRVLNMLNDKYDRLFISISMGEFGKMSRIIGGKYGSCITFSPLKKSSAPGQIDYTNMKSMLELIEE